MGYEFRSTIAAMGGKYLLPFSADRRKESGIQGGDARKEHVRSVVDAKKAETRTRRVASLVAKPEG